MKLARVGQSGDDVTSTYFEGQAEGNEKAARGYSRYQRPDCKQVNIGLVVTPEGLPVGYDGVQRKPGGRHDGGSDGTNDGGQVRPGRTDLGDGPRHGQ